MVFGDSHESTRILTYMYFKKKEKYINPLHAAGDNRKTSTYFWGHVSGTMDHKFTCSTSEDS